MEVVTARVHVAVLGGVFQTGLFGDGQPVHVTAQQHSGPWLATAQHRYNGRDRRAHSDLETQSLQRLEYLLLCPRQIIAEFGMCVKSSAQLHELGLYFLGSCNE
ncbi:hypothetical protein GCM10009824_05700 [Kocuria atrinae]|uniref:Secreted protein n=1 Tax=Kocuria atrinae TaxID=592377 RepID=A0ABP5J597_9MICC